MCLPFASLVGSSARQQVQERQQAATLRWARHSQWGVATLAPSPTPPTPALLLLSPAIPAALPHPRRSAMGGSSAVLTGVEVDTGSWAVAAMLFTTWELGDGPLPLQPRLLRLRDIAARVGAMLAWNGVAMWRAAGACGDVNSSLLAALEGLAAWMQNLWRRSTAAACSCPDFLVQAVALELERNPFAHDFSR